MSEETWHPIPQFPDYDVSNFGRVRSRKRAATKILAPWKHNSGGYPAVKLSVRGAPQQSCLVHQIVCEVFRGPKPSEAHNVAHWDGDPDNSHESNIRWATQAENCADKIRHGTHFNSGQFARTLSDSDIREIRRLITEGRLSQRVIGERYGVWQGTISGIKLGRLFSHVK